MHTYDVSIPILLPIAYLYYKYYLRSNRQFYVNIYIHSIIYTRNTYLRYIYNYRASHVDYIIIKSEEVKQLRVRGGSRAVDKKKRISVLHPYLDLYNNISVLTVAV